MERKRGKLSAWLQLRITPALLDAAYAAARRQGVSLSAFVRLALVDALEREGNPNAQ